MSKKSETDALIAAIADAFPTAPEEAKTMEELSVKWECKGTHHARIQQARRVMMQSMDDGYNWRMARESRPTGPFSRMMKVPVYWVEKAK